MMKGTTVRVSIVLGVATLVIGTVGPASAQPFGYSVNVDPTGAHPWIDATGGTQLPSGDDTLDPVTWPFDFQVYGDNYVGGVDILEVNSNGSIHFDFGGPRTFWVNCGQIPSTIDGQFVAILGDDLDPSAAGSVWYDVTGVAPNRILTVEYVDVPEFGVAAGGVVDLQVNFFEGTNDIVTQYRQVVAPAFAADGVVGINEGDGVTGQEVLCAAPAGMGLPSTDFDVHYILRVAPVAVCQNVTVDADANCEGTVTPQMVDNGSTVDPACAPLTFDLMPPGPYVLGDTPVTLTVTDQCGRSDTCTATITVVDNADPVITCPPTAGVECVADVPPPDFAGGTATDNCDPNPTVVHVGDVDNGGAGCVNDPLVITRSYRATDMANNTADCTQTIMVVDMTAPVFDTFPADAVVTCGQPTNPTATGMPTASDNCGTVNLAWTDVVTPTTCPADLVQEIITRTWTATDNCGFSVSQDQTITVLKIVASLDIKPGNCPNTHNPGSNGVLSVALVGDSGFDVSLVDIGSLQISRADCVGGSVGPNEGPPGPRTRIRDDATPFVGMPCDCHNASGDGIDDVSMKFNSDEMRTALELDQVSHGMPLELVVTGTLVVPGSPLHGCAFIATDCLRLVPPGGAGPTPAPPPQGTTGTPPSRRDGEASTERDAETGSDIRTEESGPNGDSAVPTPPSLLPQCGAGAMAMSAVVLIAVPLVRLRRR